MGGYTYIMTNKERGTLYLGVTSDLIRRVFEHKSGAGDGFTSRYKPGQLVWFESHETISAAILREKQIKAWKRDWKIQLVEEKNPFWSDLYPVLARN